MGVPPPVRLLGPMKQFDLERPISIGKQTYQTAYVSRILFSHHARLPAVCLLARASVMQTWLKGMNGVHFALVETVIDSCS